MERYNNIAEQRKWNEADLWSDGGHEWSASFGTTENLWNREIFDDVKAFRNKAILEIAPGFGRMTQFLALLTDDLTIVDLNQLCLEKTHAKLGHHVKRYVLNNGNDLPDIADSSIDLVFSYDSFVHMHRNVVEDYVAEIARVLKPGGTAFIHHSWLLDGEEESFKNWAGRATMNPELFQSYVEKYGLTMKLQKTVQFNSEGDWSGVDSISIFTK